MLEGNKFYQFFYLFLFLWAYVWNNKIEYKIKISESLYACYIEIC